MWTNYANTVWNVQKVDQERFLLRIWDNWILFISIISHVHPPPPKKNNNHTMPSSLCYKYFRDKLISLKKKKFDKIFKKYSDKE